MSDVARFLALLTQHSGIVRTRVPALDREASERSVEAVSQVGYDYISDAESGIPHPGSDAQRARLGWPSTIRVTELAIWKYLVQDPEKALADGLWASPVHHSVLAGQLGAFPFWGAGIHDAFKPGDDEGQPLLQRHYAVIWLASAIPQQQRFSDVPPTHPRYDEVEEMAELGVATGYTDGTFRPDQPVTRGELMAFLERLHDL